MSHIAQAEIVIDDLRALVRACQRLGWEWREDQTTYKWFGHWVGASPLPEGMTLDDAGHCEHAIHIPSATYEVGVVSAEDGTYRLRFDSWEGELRAAIGGSNADVLRQAYAVERQLTVAESLGLPVHERVTTTGEIILEVG
jgi:hypothetical protein